MAISRAKSNLQRGFKLCLLALCFILMFSTLAYAQGIVNLTIHDEVYAFIKRLTARDLIRNSLTNSQPLMRREIAGILIEITERHRSGQIKLTDVEKAHLERFQWLFANEINALKPGSLPQVRKIHAVTIRGEDYKLNFDFKLKEEVSHVSPSSEDKETTSITSTKLLLRGKLGNYLGISSSINGRLLVGSGSYNPYKNEFSNSYSGLLKGESRTMNSMLAYAVLDLPWLSFQWGMDSLWWGPGWHGALLLSDNSAPTDTLKLSGLYGPIRFTFLTSVLRTRVGNIDEYYPKYMSAHRIEISPYPGIDVGVSEVVVFVERYEPRYLNPFLVFFGSHVDERRSNGMLGFDLDITFLPSVELYAEIMIDDFQSDQGLEAFRVWNSKYGILAGGYWVDPIGLKDSDIRMEYAFVNQYAYTSTREGFLTDYTHQDFVIGHWMGTDAENLWLRIGHWFTDKLHVSVAYERERHGEGDVNRSRTWDEDLPEYWEFLSGVTELTHSFSARLLYNSIGRYSTSIEYTYSQLRNIGHERRADGEGHQLVISAEYRF